MPFHLHQYDSSDLVYCCNCTQVRAWDLRERNRRPQHALDECLGSLFAFSFFVAEKLNPCMLDAINSSSLLYCYIVHVRPSNREHSEAETCLGRVSGLLCLLLSRETYYWLHSRHLSSNRMELDEISIFWQLLVATEFSFVWCFEWNCSIRSRM